MACDASTVFILFRVGAGILLACALILAWRSRKPPAESDEAARDEYWRKVASGAVLHKCLCSEPVIHHSGYCKRCDGLRE